MSEHDDNKTLIIRYIISFERGSKWRTVKNIDTNIITVGELKVLLAHELGVDKEFARALDIHLQSLNEKNLVTDKAWTNDQEIIEANTNFIITRTSWINNPSYKIAIDGRFCNWVTNDNLIKSDYIPSGLVCGSCNNYAKNAYSVKCKNGCINNLCSSCKVSIKDDFIKLCLVCRNYSVVDYVSNDTLSLFVDKAIKNAIKANNNYAETKEIIYNTIESIDKSHAQNTQHSNNSYIDDEELQDCDLFILLLPSDKLNFIFENNYFVTTYDNNSLTTATLEHYNNIFVIPIAQGGGGTSLLSIGIIKIKNVYGISNNRIDSIGLYLADDHPKYKSNESENTERTSGNVIIIDKQRKNGMRDIENCDNDKNSNLNNYKEVKAEKYLNIEWCQMYKPLVNKWLGNKLDDPIDEEFLCYEINWKQKYNNLVMFPSKVQPLAPILNSIDIKKCLTDETLFIKIQEIYKKALYQKLYSISANLSNCNDLNNSCKLVKLFTNISKEIHNIQPIYAKFSKEDQKTSCLKVYDFINYNTPLHWAKELNYILPTDWAGINPMLPWISWFPYLTEHEFNIIQKLQYIVLTELLKNQLIYGELVSNIKYIHKK